LEKLLVPDQAAVAIPGTQILVLAPHPDDEVFGCGGAILRHVEHGQPVAVIVVTDGSYGVSAEEADAYVAQRRNESIAAARLIGYGVPVFWNYRDREISYSEKMVQKIREAITDVGADLVYSPSVFEMHPDHRALGMIVVEAVRRLGKGVRLALYEVGMPLCPNLLLDISDLATRKMAAMACFVSQNARQRYDLDIAALNRYRTYTLPAHVTAAEAYILLAAETLASDPLKLYQSEYARQKSLGLVLDSSETPLVSVIIRSIDRPTLSDALDSVALQTYANIEVIIVNAKGDDHRPVGDWCGRFPVRRLDLGKSLTRSQAANVGLEASHGDYLIFLDDDDWFAPHHIARLKTEFEGSESAVAVYSAVQCVNESGVETKRFEEAFDPIQFRIDNFVPIHAVLFRRHVVDNGTRFDESLTVCEDWDFWLQVLECGGFLFVPEVGATYRMHDAASSGVWVNAEQTQQVMIAIYRKWIPRWNDKTLWSVLEFARYKRLFIELSHTMNEYKALLVERDLQVTSSNQFVIEREAQITSLSRGLIECEAQITALNHGLIESEAQITALNQSVTERDAKIADLLASTSWRITRPIRRIMTFFLRRRAS